MSMWATLRLQRIVDHTKEHALGYDGLKKILGCGRTERSQSPRPCASTQWHGHQQRGRTGDLAAEPTFPLDDRPPTARSRVFHRLWKGQMTVEHVAANRRRRERKRPAGQKQRADVRRSYRNRGPYPGKRPREGEGNSGSKGRGNEGSNGGHFGSEG